MQYQEQESIGVFTNLIYLPGNQLVGQETLPKQAEQNSTDVLLCYMLSVAGNRGITAVK
jgi:hypothetical protein